MKHGLLKLALVSLTMMATPALAETVAISDAKLVIGDGSAPIDGATIVMKNGRIVAAGQGVNVPAGARRIDAGGKYVTPGIFAGFSRVGLVEVGAVSETNDSRASGSQFSAALDVADAINSDAKGIAVNRAAGVTRALVAPSTGDNIFAGIGAVIDLGQDMQPIMKRGAFQFVEMGERGSSRAGGSRTATYALFRAMLNEARRFGQSRANYNQEILSRADAEALQSVISGKTKLVVHAESASDILRVIKLRKDFPKLDIVLVGAAEGWRVAPQIAAAKIPVLASAMNSLPESFEMLASTQSSIGRMKRAGVTLGIAMINDRDAHQLRYTPQYAGNMVAISKVPGATGLSWDEAFAAITSGPAKVMGLDGEIGSLKAGRRADVVIWDGDPLELSSSPLMVMIDGVEQSLSNRQIRLRDRYVTPNEGVLPKAYEY